MKLHPRGLWVTSLRIATQSDHWTSEYSSVNNTLRYLQMRRTNSLSTKTGCFRTLHKLCLFAGRNPDELVRMEKTEIEQYVRDYSESVKNRTGWGATANLAITHLKLFFRENGFRRETGRELVVELFRVPPRSSKVKEYIPTPEEAIRMAEAYGLGSRNYAAILMLAFTGLRNSTLRALLYGDIRQELEEGKENLLVRIHKDMKRIDPNACKGEIPYFVFTDKKTTNAIRLYLAARTSRSGKLPDDAPLFPTTSTRIGDRRLRNSTILSNRELQIAVKEGARRAGIEDWKFVTPHKLRKTFKSFLINQPPESRLDQSDQIFFEGHLPGGSEDAYYDKTKIENMRAKFSKLVVERDPSMQIASTMARGVGLDPASLRADLARTLGRDPTLSEEVAELTKHISEMLHHGQNSSRKTTKVIAEELLEKYLDEGWRFVASLGSGKAVVEKEVPPSDDSPDLKGKLEQSSDKKVDNHPVPEARSPSSTSVLPPKEGDKPEHFPEDDNRPGSLDRWF